MKRKLLLIMPNFFDYPQAICEELEKMGGWGYEVDCFDDRPSTNGMVKAIIQNNWFGTCRGLSCGGLLQAVKGR